MFSTYSDFESKTLQVPLLIDILLTMIITEWMKMVILLNEICCFIHSLGW